MKITESKLRSLISETIKNHSGNNADHLAHSDILALRIVQQLQQLGVEIQSDPIHFKHQVTYYIPCFQDNSNITYPTLTHDTAHVCDDLQLVASLNPDFILELTGLIDYTTKEIK